jgi:hypothetical protein
MVFETGEGGTPPAQTVTISSTGSALAFYQSSPTGKGNDWLQVPSCNNSVYPCSTPSTLAVGVVSSGLPVGSYFAQINVFEDTNPSESMTIPVILVVTP